ncbi:hypothetical protein WKR88_20355 [Trinickia caryophylli]|uniref:Uncharacterized protein n=1 Tax=Trinickia caryophylli TaxID=28094 RepID=A0A1X7G8U4_TRICW|nr:hypothetical protein [Trinickia caryophylli]WQE11632.1 hypothetical protein U0034_18105 [Trinickia caryophylli]SMF65868.1 hypothetical protein SAMN06295900_11462 [Trinickia caryophylli]
MKRMLAAVLFLAGGFAAELRHPLQCTLVASGWTQPRRGRRRA